MKRKASAKRLIQILTPAEQDAFDAAVEARGGWVDITPPQLGTAAEREAIGWEKAYTLATAAMSDYSVQQSPNAMKLFALLVDLFADARPDDWIDDFVRITRHEVASATAKARADARHAPSKCAKEWVRQHYENKGDQWDSKIAFCRDYVPLVKAQFGVEVKAKEIAERWLKACLKPSPSQPKT